MILATQRFCPDYVKPAAGSLLRASSMLIQERPVRVLLLHNRYQIPGGEDAAVRQETAMLRDAGLTVDLLEADNDAITTTAGKISTALLTPYSPSARRLVAGRIRSFRPDIVHVHNFFPRLSPSVYDACRDARVPVIQTLHNYRILCANALLFRENRICTDCLGRTVPLPALRHGCYRYSRIGSAALVTLIGVHRIRQTWARRVTRFIALTEFARGLFTEHAGIPHGQIAIKPNAAPDPGQGDGSGGYALFIGRLSQEKGIATLLEAAGRGLGMPLKIAGSGPLQPVVEAAQISDRIEYLGQQDPEQVRELMRQARVLLIPSLWFEGLPMVVPEAFGAGLPIIASRIGALETLIDDGANGLLAEPGNAESWVEAVRRFSTEPGLEQRLRQKARQTYETLYRPEVNVGLLLEIYEQAQAVGLPNP
jgi:glycosyltransferase involved in cell wall biosynthesis